ncbi:MAG: flagellar export chaperone FliS [Oceanospirillaceae bacterium]|nr:flagellar export chaperone FliS [Oceanospirillaceae bacterium]
MNYIKAGKAYQQVNISSAVEGASPHHLISMLFEGLIKRMAEAKGAIDRKDTSAKGTSISKAIDIVGELQGSLRDTDSNEVAANLDRLYDYIARTLVQANLESSQEKLDEVARLVIEIKAGWDGIANAATSGAE